MRLAPSLPASPSRRLRQPTCRPRLETLEDRCVPSAGDLDPTFGSGGVVTTSVGRSAAYGNDMALQADGKIVVVGQGQATNADTGFALARYTTAGSLDTSFGSGSTVVTKFGEQASAVAVQADGKVVVAGGNGNFALARYTASGSLDNSFGNKGKVTTDLGGYDSVTEMVIQPDGKIVVAGYTQVGFGGDTDFALARYNVNGSLDTTFGVGGKVTHRIVNSNEAFYGLALQTDGKVVAVGDSGLVWTVARYDTNGTPDASFGSGGFVTTPFATSTRSEADAVTVQSDGKVVVAGQSAPSGRNATWDFALVRYRADGVLDSSFGSGGKVYTDYAKRSDGANAAVLQPDGKILAAGFFGVATSGDDAAFGLARYTSNGTLDATFGEPKSKSARTGKVSTNFGPGFDQAYGIALQPDGKILLAGHTISASFDSDAALARYLPDGTLDPTFGVGGKVVTDLGGYDQIYGVALQSDGKVVVAGMVIAPNDDRYTSVARYNPNGTLDGTFGSGGIVLTRAGGPSPSDAYWLDVAVQGDGKIVATGRDDRSLALARYLDDGTLDDTFATGGMLLVTPGSGSAEGTAVHVQPDGKIVLSGSSPTLLRTDPFGNLDPTFGSGGTVVTAGLSPRDMALQADGRIVAAGPPALGFNGLVVARYLGDTTASAATILVTPPVASTTTLEEPSSLQITLDTVAASLVLEQAQKRKG